MLDQALHLVVRIHDSPNNRTLVRSAIIFECADIIDWSLRAIGLGNDFA